MRLAVPLSLSFALIAVPGAAQNQALLERALEGREVTVLLEMPASHRGIDLHVQQEPEMDFSEYARRIKQHGVALRKEDRVMITAVKVNKKNIEVHLGGGGYGTWGDDSGTVSARYVGKSGRESDLEKERKRTKDAERIRDIDRELGYLRRDREREEREARREAEALAAIKQREVSVKRLDGGSRFNIWYADKRLQQWAPTPEELVLTLSRYIAFEEEGTGRGSRFDVARLTDDRGARSRSEDVEVLATSLKRGMSQDDVHDLLGRPTRRRESTQGDLTSIVETWETTDSVTEVSFVGGVVVKFTSSSK